MTFSMTRDDHVPGEYNCYKEFLMKCHHSCSRDNCRVQVYNYKDGAHPPIPGRCYVVGIFHRLDLILGILFTPEGSPYYSGTFYNFLPDGEGMRFRLSPISFPVQRHKEEERNAAPLLHGLSIYQEGTFERGYLIYGQAYSHDGRLRYNGSWSFDPLDEVSKYHGVGRYYARSGDILDGYFENFVSFTGRHYTRDGNILYEGEMRFNYDTSSFVRHGEGFYWKNGLLYETTSRNGRLHGLVNIIKRGAFWAQQATFRYGRIVGRQYYVNSIGTRFYGKLGQDGQPHGNGEMKSPNGDIFEGTFQRGKLHGEGFAYSARNGVSHQGIWQNGLRDGPGKETSDRLLTSEMALQRDLIIYDGRWERGEKHGNFIVTKGGETFHESWSYGKLCGKPTAIANPEGEALHRRWMKWLQFVGIRVM